MRCSSPLAIPRSASSAWLHTAGIQSRLENAIVMLGGLGNIAGATLGGFILAFVEELGAGYISSGYRDAMGFLIIIIVLLFKPTGLFTRAERIG